MAESLRSLRLAKGLSQHQVGTSIADHLRQSIGSSYAQKKIARFEAGAAAPTESELLALAKILAVKIETLRSIVKRAPQQAVALVDDLAAGDRSLMAICLLAKPRPQPIAESYGAVKRAIEEKNFSIAAFLPYPSGVNLPSSHHINNLVGYYTRAINDVKEANLAFKSSLKKRADAVALYVPKPELLKRSAVLLPPLFRQFSLTVKQTDRKGPLTKSLQVWTPGKDIDTGRPLKATGTYTLYDQIDAWQSFFGQVIPYWVENDRLTSEDEYWKRLW